MGRAHLCRFIFGLLGRGAADRADSAKNSLRGFQRRSGTEARKGSAHEDSKMTSKGEGAGNTQTGALRI